MCVLISEPLFIRCAIRLCVCSLPRCLYLLSHNAYIQGICLGIADGVGGWVEEGIDPSLFSQSLMYHAHRYAKLSWAGEPEIDPTQEYEEREQVEGWELTPRTCLQLAFDSVLRDRLVPAGVLT